MVLGRSDLCELEVIINHQTEKGVLVNDGKRSVWLPKAAVQLEEMPDKPGRYILTIPEILALEKELI